MAGKVKWVSDIDRTVLVSNFERLGWVRGSTEGHEGKLDCVRIMKNINPRFKHFKSEQSRCVSIFFITGDDWNFYW